MGDIDGLSRYKDTAFTAITDISHQLQVNDLFRLCDPTTPHDSQLDDHFTCLNALCCVYPRTFINIPQQQFHMSVLFSRLSCRFVHMLCIRFLDSHRLARQMVSPTMRSPVYSKHIQDWLAVMVTLCVRNSHRPLSDISSSRLVHIQTYILFPDCCRSQLYVSIILCRQVNRLDYRGLFVWPEISL